MGVKISKPGRDISSTSPNDFFLDSDYPLLQVAAYGTFTTDMLGTFRVNHNLGYKPFVIVMSQMALPAGYDQSTITPEMCQHDWTIGGGMVDIFGYTEVFDDRIEINIGHSMAVYYPDIKGFYYIFRNEM